MTSDKLAKFEILFYLRVIESFKEGNISKAIRIFTNETKHYVKLTYK